MLEKDIFEELFKTHFKPLCGFANKYLKDVDLAKEIVHDVFVKLWEKREQIDMNKAVKSYLYTAVNNKSLNHIRDNKKFVNSDYIIENETDWNYSDNLVELEIQEKITATLDSLPPKCREVFKLSRYENLKYKQIAERLNISVKTVESHMSKALKALRKNLSEYLTSLLLLIISQM